MITSFSGRNRVFWVPHTHEIVCWTRISDFSDFGVQWLRFSWYFPKSIQLWWAVSPSWRKVGSSDRYRCEGLSINFATHLIRAKTGTSRKSYTRSKFLLFRKIRKIHLHHPTSVQWKLEEISAQDLPVMRLQNQQGLWVKPVILSITGGSWIPPNGCRSLSVLVRRDHSFCSVPTTGFPSCGRGSVGKWVYVQTV